MIELIQVGIVNILAKLLKFSFEIGTNFFVSKESYGQFAIMLSFILIYSRILTFGIPNVMLREFPKSKTIKYISFNIYNAFLLISFVFVFLYLLSNLFNIKYLSDYWQIQFISYFTALLAIYSVYLRSNGEVKKWIYFQEIHWYIIYFIIITILYFIIRNNITIKYLLTIYFIAISSTLLLLLFYLKHKNIDLISKLSIKKIKYLASHSFPVLFTGLTYLILARIDIIMLDKYVSYDLVGEYNIIARITIQVLFLYQIMTVYFYPQLAKKFAQNKSITEISSFYTKFVFLSFLSVLFLTTILFLWLKYFGLFELLHIKHQEELMNVFYLFSLTQIVYVCIGSYGYILLYINKQKIEYFNNALILIVGITLNYLLIPIYGMIGATLATTIAILLGSLLEMIQVKYFINTIFIRIL